MTNQKRTKSKPKKRLKNIRLLKKLIEKLSGQIEEHDVLIEDLYDRMGKLDALHPPIIFPQPKRSRK